MSGHSMGLSRCFDFQMDCTTGGGRFVKFEAFIVKFSFGTLSHSIPLVLKIWKQSKYKLFQIDPAGLKYVTFAEALHVWSKFQLIWSIFCHFMANLRPILGLFSLYKKYEKSPFFQTSTHVCVYKSRTVDFLIF